MARNKFLLAAPLFVGSLAVAGGIALAPEAAAAATTNEIRYTASDDSYTSSVRKVTTFGGADKLVAGRTNGETKVAYLKFTVAKPAAGTKVSGAQLVLRTDGHAVPGTLRLQAVADTAWTEKKLNHANAPRLGAVLASVKPGDATTVKLDLSTVVKGAGTYSFALTSSALNDSARFMAQESGNSGPELRVTLASTQSQSPTTTPTQTPTQSPAPTPAECTVDAKLVPSCGVLWGAAAGGFSSTPRDQALKEWEQASGRTATIFHTYHKGDEVFPTKAEIAMTRDAANPRVLLLNWKVAENSTWAKVAAGGMDARIDKFAAHVKANYNQPFFLAPHHEPENDVNPTAGSGMTAKDYAAMYRHVVKRLKDKGVTNAINVIAYMGNEGWMAKSWWGDLYPGDDVVDWIGLDSYVSAEAGTYHYGDFASLLDRKPKGGVGFYDWAVTQHASKPIMVAEWGAYHSLSKTVDKSFVFNSVVPTLTNRPAIKAIVAFDALADDEGDRNLTITSSPESLASFKKLAADPIFKVKLG